MITELLGAQKPQNFRENRITVIMALVVNHAATSRHTAPRSTRQRP